MALTTAQRAAIRANIKLERAQLRGEQTTIWPATARARVEYSVDGKPMANGFHVICSTPRTPESLQVLADAIADAWFTTILGPQLASNVTQGLTTLQGVSSATDPTAVSTHHSGGIGGNGSGAAPRSVVAVVNFSTGLGGRSNRGRLFLSGFPVSFYEDIAAGRLQGSAATILQTAFQSFNTAITTAGSGLVIASRTTGLVHPVTQVSVNTQAGSQRKRLRP